MAARMMVVLPQPASPSRSVMPFRAATAYSRLLNASRCASVITRNRGLGVRSKGRSRNPKNRSYIGSRSVDERVGDNRESEQNGRGAGEPDQHLLAESPLSFGRGLHGRNNGKNRQGEQPHDLVIGLEALIPVLEQCDQQDADAKTGSEGQSSQPRTVGAKRLLRETSRVQWLELFPDLRHFEVLGNLGILFLLEQCRVHLLQRDVIARQLCHFGLALRRRFHPRLVAAYLCLQLLLLRLFPRDLSLEYFQLC